MTEDKSVSKFGVGLFIGALAGALAGIFYAPKSGKQTRKVLGKKLDELREKFSEMEIDKKVQDIFGQVSEEAKDQYLSVTKDLLEKLAKLKGRVEEIDTKKYQKMVEEVLEDFKKKGEESATVIGKMRKHLIADWQSLFAKSASPKRGAKKPRTRSKK